MSRTRTCAKRTYFVLIFGAMFPNITIRLWFAHWKGVLTTASLFATQVSSPSNVIAVCGAATQAQIPHVFSSIHKTLT